MQTHAYGLCPWSLAMEVAIAFQASISTAAKSSAPLLAVRSATFKYAVEADSKDLARPALKDSSDCGTYTNQEIKRL